MYCTLLFLWTTLLSWRGLTWSMSNYWIFIQPCPGLYWNVWSDSWMPSMNRFIEIILGTLDLFPLSDDLSNFNLLYLTVSFHPVIWLLGIRPNEKYQNYSLRGMKKSFLTGIVHCEVCGNQKNRDTRERIKTWIHHDT